MLYGISGRLRMLIWHDVIVGYVVYSRDGVELVVSLTTQKRYSFSMWYLALSISSQKIDCVSGTESWKCEHNLRKKMYKDLKYSYPSIYRAPIYRVPRDNVPHCVPPVSCFTIEHTYIFAFPREAR